MDFHSVKQIRIGLAMATMITALIGSQTGSVWVVGLVICLIIVQGVYEYKFWRCPHCGTYLGKYLHSEFCQHCGKNLYQ